MKLAIFSTLEAAQTKLSELSSLAKNTTTEDPFWLSGITRSVDGSFFWFYYDPDCVINAGLGLGEILKKELEMDIIEFDEVPESYFGDSFF